MSDDLAATRAALRRHLDNIRQMSTDARLTKAGDFYALMSMGHELHTMELQIELALGYWAALAGDAGASWRQIGDAIGVSRSRAHQRYSAMMADRPLAQPDTAAPTPPTATP